MNSLKSVLILFLILFALNNILAQETYIKINTGYALESSSQSLYLNGDFFNLNTVYSNPTEEVDNISLGKGLSLGGVLGRMFNKNIGVELGVSYFIGAKSESKFTHSSTSKYGSAYWTDNYILSASMLRITPAIIIESKFNAINPYIKFGLIVGRGSVIYEADNTYEYGGVRKANMKLILSGGLAYGWSASVGSNFSLNDNISLFGEINMINLSYAPTKGKTEYYTVNDGLDHSQPNIVYVDGPNEWGSKNYTLGENEKIKQNLPFGSLGLNIGLRIAFQSKKND